MDDFIQHDFDFNDLSGTLESYITNKKLAGLVALVYHNDKIVYSKNLGASNLQNSIPIFTPFSVL